MINFFLFCSYFGSILLAANLHYVVINCDSPAMDDDSDVPDADDYTSVTDNGVPCHLKKQILVKEEEWYNCQNEEEKSKLVKEIQLLEIKYCSVHNELKKQTNTCIKNLCRNRCRIRYTKLEKCHDFPNVRGLKTKSTRRYSQVQYRFLYSIYGVAVNFTQLWKLYPGLDHSQVVQCWTKLSPVKVIPHKRFISGKSGNSYSLEEYLDWYGDLWCTDEIEQWFLKLARDMHTTQISNDD